MESYSLKTWRERIKAKTNYYCILSEGIANIMGGYLLGLATIVPLFLLEYGASLGLIGIVTTIQGVSSALMPLLFGGIVARAASKKKLSIIVNGFSRGIMLLVPFALLLALPNNLIIMVFLFAVLVLFLGGPISGLTWNYLIGDCIEINDRPKLIGVIFTVSGIIGLGSSNFIKLIRDSLSLSSNMKYFYIFGLAAFTLTSSVLFYIPLRESPQPIPERDILNIKAYLKSLGASFKNHDFKILTWSSIFSYISFVLNSFIFVYADRTLNLASHLISNLIIYQTIGIILGGIVTGQVAARLGVKRMLVLIEILSLLIPIIALSCIFVENPYIPVCIAVFLLGFYRSGQNGYNNYLIEVVDQDKLIIHMISKGIVLLPLSFLSTVAGLYIESHSMILVFIIQIIASGLAIYLCSRLRLIRRE